MALSLTYTDAYLKNRVTDTIEYRAYADVDNIATFPAEWRNRLVVIRAYIITCLEQSASEGDAYASKLKDYRKEFEFVMNQAKNALAASDTSTNVNQLTVAIERA